MKKNLLYFLGFSILPMISSAQSQAGLEGNIMIFKNRDVKIESVAGSQYFNEYFGIANVNDMSENFNLRYNNYKDIMEYQKNANEILELNPEQYSTIMFANGHNYFFKSYINSKDLQTKGYLKLIDSKNNIAIYSSERVTYKPAEKSKSSYDTDKQAQFVKEKKTFFLETDGKIQQISKTKDIQKIFSSKENELKEYFKKNKIDFDNENQLKQLITFLNTL